MRFFAHLVVAYFLGPPCIALHLLCTHFLAINQTRAIAELCITFILSAMASNLD